MKKGYIISGITVVVSAVIAIVLYAKNKAMEGFDEIRDTTSEDNSSSGESSKEK